MGPFWPTYQALHGLWMLPWYNHHYCIWSRSTIFASSFAGVSCMHQFCSMHSFKYVYVFLHPLEKLEPSATSKSNTNDSELDECLRSNPSWRGRILVSKNSYLLSSLADTETGRESVIKAFGLVQQYRRPQSHVALSEYSALTSRLSNSRGKLHHTLTLSGQPRQSQIGCVLWPYCHIVSIAAGIARTSSTSPLVERGLISIIELQGDFRKGEEVQRELIKHSLSPDKLN